MNYIDRIIADVYFQKERNSMFEAIEYVVVAINGDYADLKRTDGSTEDIKLVARALLPEAIMEGSILKYEMMTYTMVS